MAKGVSRRNGIKIPPVSIVLGFAPLVAAGINQFKAGGITSMDAMTSYLIPYNPRSKKLTMENLGQGLFPILAGFAVHRFVGGSLGVNRMLGRAGIPLRI